MADKRAITVLYVDDEEANLFLFKVTFQNKYNVLTANSAVVGLAELQNHYNEIIVVISDMNMPQMNGIEFIKKAKKEYQNIVYYILTGFDYNDQIDSALKSNLIQKFFTKPFNAAEIEAAIEQAAKKS